MLLWMVFILGGASAWIELKIIRSVPALQAMERFTLWSVAFSMFLSYILGVMFGATGTICFMAGLVSTGITELWRYWKRVERENIAPILKAKKRVETTAKWSKETQETYKWLFFIMKWIVIICLSPIWIPVLMHHNKKQGLTLGDNWQSFRARKLNSQPKKLVA